MSIVSLKVVDNFLNVSKNCQSTDKMHVNSDGFFNSEMICSPTHIAKNVFKLSKIISNTCKSNAISTVKFDDYFAAKTILPCLVDNEYLKNYIFSFESSIKKDIYANLVKNGNIRYIECLFMPNGFVKQLGKENVSIKFNQNETFGKKFIEQNNLKSMNNMYYKRKVCVCMDTLDDFRNFLRINKSLKAVYLNNFTLQLLDKVLVLIGDRDISVYIVQSQFNTNIISENIKKLKKINKEFSNFNRDISIMYSSSYFKNNFFRQLNYNNLKLCSLVVIYVGVIMLLANRYNDYKSWLSVQLINNELASSDISAGQNSTVNDNQDDIFVEDVTETAVEVPKQVVELYSNLPNTFDELLKINNETVGWLKLNNTKINYPVVQHNNNDYYLNHDFYNKRTSNGWIFLDYRNNPSDFSQNSIIYGHSLLSKVLFGTLHTVLYPSWYKNTNNQIITYSTASASYRFQIFSIYKIEVTSDYLKTRFEPGEFEGFANMLKARSIYDFGESLNASDKILTLSTCTGASSENKRLVVHAKLLND